MNRSDMIVDGKEVRTEEEKDTVCGQWVQEQYTSDLTQLRAGYCQTAVDGPAPRFLPMSNEVPVAGCTITGRTGSGKSVLLTHLLVQEAYRGKGFCLIDLHPWTTATDILQRIPKSRLNDVLWIDATAGQSNKAVGISKDTIVPMNPLLVGASIETTSNFFALSREIAGDLGAVLLDSEHSTEEDYTKFNEIVESLIRAKQEYTLLDLYNLITKNEEGQELTDQIQGLPTHTLNSVWNDTSTQNLYCLGLFRALSYENFRYMTTQKQSGFNLRDAVNDNSIIIITGNSSSEHSTTRTRIISATILRRLKRYIGEAESVESPYLVGIEWAYETLDKRGRLFTEMFDDAKSPLSPLIVCQYPSQFPESYKESIFESISTNLTFSLGNTLLKNVYPSIDTTGSESIEAIFDVKEDTISNLPEHQFIMQTNDAAISSGYAFAPLPPKRSLTSVENILQNNLQRYITGTV